MTIPVFLPPGLLMTGMNSGSKWMRVLVPLANHESLLPVVAMLPNGTAWTLLHVTARTLLLYLNFPFFLVSRI